MEITTKITRGWIRRGDGLAIQRGDKVEGKTVINITPPKNGWVHGDWKYMLADKDINWCWGEKINSIFGDFVVTTWDCGCRHRTGNLKMKSQTQLCGEHTKLPPRRHRNIF